MQHYFASDGNYGDATELIIVHTDSLTEDDWRIIEESPDSARQQVVCDLIYKKQNQIPTRILGL
jgi:hypothetical protein